MNIAKLTLLLCAVACVAACVPEPRPSNFEDQDPAVQESPIIQTGPLKPTSSVKLGEGTGDPNMTGTWLLGWLNSSCVPSYGEQVGISYQLVTIKQQGNTIREEHKICDYNLSQVSIAKPEIPEKTRETAIILTPDYGYVNKAAAGESYVSPTVITTFGYHSDQQAHPATDPIPTKAEKNGPLAFDADGDGQPGSTFYLHMLGKTCHRSTIQRQVTRYVGSFTTPNMIKGKTYDHTETVLLEASGGIGCSNDASPKANDKNSEFAMARIDGKGASTNADEDSDGVITCAEAKPYFDQIMPVRPPKGENCQ